MSRSTSRSVSAPLSTEGAARRRALLGLGAAALGLGNARAQAPASGSPYAMLGHGECSAGGLACANAATPCSLPDGSLWLAWSGDGAIWASRSTDGGRRFDPAVELARHGATLDIGPDARPQIVAAPGGGLMVAYAYFADDKWNARVNVVSSIDSGRSFSAPQPLTPASSSQRFPTLAVDGRGRVFAAWVDKRLVDADARRGIKRDGASIAFAWAPAIGQAFGPDAIAQPSSCECCRIAAALRPDGRPVLLDRALLPGSIRDHVCQSFSDDHTPGAPTRVADDHWVSRACPHHGPALALADSGTLHAAWFTQGSKRAGVFHASSRDGGARFDAPRAVAPAARAPGRPALLALGRSTWLAWKEFDGTRASIQVRRSDDDGRTWSAAHPLASAAGYTDHPLLLVHAGRPCASWLTRESGYRLIELA